MSDSREKNGAPIPDGDDISQLPASESDQTYDLHSLFDAPPQDLEDPLSGLRNDPNYAALIRDLEYIAKEARKLFEPASEEPSDAVWDNIQRKLGNSETN